MLALMSTGGPSYLEIDDDRFMSAVRISGESNDGAGHSSDQEDTARTLQLLRTKGLPRPLPEGVLALVNYCRYLGELSLSCSLLSEELLEVLGTEKDDLRLETLRLEAHPEERPIPRISQTAWHDFHHRLPGINLVLLSYMTSEEDQERLIAPWVPVTHLYFGEAPSEETLSKVGSGCHRLTELVIAVYNSGPLDNGLLTVARGCPNLEAIGLGDCELSCTAVLDFVALCARRLQILYVWETSLTETADLDVANLTAKVSLLLGRAWVPEYIPIW